MQGRSFLFGKDVEDRFAEACAWSRRVWRPLMKRIGKGGQFHGLRHRGAHTAWVGKAAIETISKMLGHSTIAQTEHYIGVTEESMWEAANATAVLNMQKPAPAEVATAAVNQVTKKPEAAWLGF